MESREAKFKKIYTAAFWTSLICFLIGIVIIVAPFLLVVLPEFLLAKLTMRSFSSADFTPLVMITIIFIFLNN